MAARTEARARQPAASPRAEESGHWFGALVRLALASLALAYLLGWVAYGTAAWLGLLRAGWPSLVRELSLYLFLPLPALLLLALLARARAAFVLLALVLVVFLAGYGSRLLPARAVAAPAPSFTLLSFNTGANAGGGTPAPLLRTIRATAADVVALQEVPAASQQVLGAELGADYPYSARFPDAPDMIVFSRYPLREAGGLPLSRGAFVGQRVTVEIDGRAVVLVNIHLSRPSYRLRWLGGVLPTVRAFDPLGRDAQVAELVDYLRTIDGPRLLVGDFNASEWSHSHRLLAAGLADTFAEAGHGLGHTYPSHIWWGNWQVSLPLLRIDYVFHSADLTALDATVGPDGGSDHLPVVAKLQLR